ncbi:MAG: PQQ-like beta-propeller repeat protein [Calditrichaeota bacterium]|nr:PQQ-like beta-propeller repeat protein [Calditrichota bacterium]
MRRAVFVSLGIFSWALVWCARDKTPLGPAEGPAVCPQQEIPWPSLANSPWPMYRHDPQFTGRSQYIGPRKGRIKWTFQPDAGGIIWPAVVIGPDSTIYFSTHREITPEGGQEPFFYAVTPRGTLKWKYHLASQASDGSAMLLADGSILVPCLSSWLILNPDGSLRRNLQVRSPSQPNIGLDGTLYLVDRHDALCAVTQEGTFKWTLRIDDGFSWQGVALSPDGTSLYGFTFVQPSGPGSSIFHAALCAVGVDGSLRWRFALPESTQIPMGLLPMVDCSGATYFGIGLLSQSLASQFCSVAPSGKLNWSVEAFYSWWETPAIDSHGNLYFYDAWWGQRLLSVDCRGCLRWWHALSDELYAGAVCDAEDVVYVPEGKLLALDRDGSLLWSVPLVGSFSRIAAPAIGANGILYLGTYGVDSRLYAIE